MQICPRCGGVAPYNNRLMENKCTGCGWTNRDSDKDASKRRRMKDRRSSRRRKNEQRDW